MNVEALSFGVSHPGLLKFAAKHPRGVWRSARVAKAMDKKSLGYVPGRFALGATMLFHGYSKLKEEAREPTAQFFEKIGLKPGKFWGVFTGVAEIFAGASAVLGIGTRIGALAVIISQAVAINKVHAEHGFDATKGGFEWNLALIALAAGLLVAGPGNASVHEGLERALQKRARRKLFFFGPRKSLRLVKLLK